MLLRSASLVVLSTLLNVLALAAAGLPELSEITGPASTTCAESPAVTVRLTQPAPSGGLVIQLVTSVPAVIALPSSPVTVATGELSVTFRPSCFPKSTNNPVTLTATAGGVSRSMVINVLAPVLQSIAIGAQSSSSARTATVTLAAPAVQAFNVTLLSSNPAAASVPAGLTIPAGQSAATFTVTTFPAAQPASATISAILGTVTRTATLSVPGSSITDGTSNTVGFTEGSTTEPPAAPASVTFQSGLSFVSSKTITGGQIQQAKVTLDRLAGTGGVTVALSSSNPAAAPVPASISVPAGQNSATFNISTIAVAQTATVTVSATAARTTRSATFTVSPQTTSVTDGTSNTVGFTEGSTTEQPAVPASVTFQSGLSFVSSKTITGGQFQQAKVTLDRVAGTSGVTVALSSSNPSSATVPASITIAAGQNSATFNISTIAVAQTATAIISATAGRTTRSATLTVSPQTTSVTDGTSNTIGFTEEQPAVPASVTFQSGLSFVSSKTITGGQVQQAKVTLDRVAGTSGVTVALNSSNPSAATVPASITVAAGQNSATFNISTIAVAQTATAIISATAGRTTRSATLTVSPPTTSVTDGTSNTIALAETLTFSVSPQQVQGGSSITGQISAPASSTGLVVKLSAPDTYVTYPRSISFGAGETVKSFTVTTNPVALSKQVTITAVLDQGASTLTTSRQLTILPPQLAGLTLSHGSAPANTTVTGKVVLTGPAAPDLPFAIAISDSSAAKVTSKVDVAPGSSSGTFSLVTAQVQTETSVKVTITLGTASMSALLRVTP